MDFSVKKFVLESSQLRPRMISFGVTTGAAQVETITAPAFAAAAQGDYIVISNQAGLSIAVWLDKNAAGTLPTGAAYLASTYKAKASIATGDTATVVATAMKTALSTTLPNVTFADNLNGTITVTQTVVGTCTDIVKKNTGDTGAGSITATTGTDGAAVAGGNGKFDATITQAVTGTYVITFDRAFVRAPEAGVTCKTDNRFARISACTVSAITIETQNITSGATADASFSLIVLGSDAVDAIKQQ